jgi:hypothetical protein
MFLHTCLLRFGLSFGSNMAQAGTCPRRTPRASLTAAENARRRPGAERSSGVRRMVRKRPGRPTRTRASCCSRRTLRSVPAAARSVACAASERRRRQCKNSGFEFVGGRARQIASACKNQRRPRPRPNLEAGRGRTWSQRFTFLCQGLLETSRTYTAVALVL